MEDADAAFLAEFLDHCHTSEGGELVNSLAKAGGDEHLVPSQQLPAETEELLSNFGTSSNEEEAEEKEENAPSNGECQRTASAATEREKKLKEPFRWKNAVKSGTLRLPRDDYCFERLSAEDVDTNVVRYDAKRNQGVLYFDGADRIVFPYSFDQVSEAISTIIMSYPDASIETVKATASKNTLTMKYRVQFKGQGEFDGLQSYETCWMVARPPHDSDFAAKGSTIVESYGRLVPMGLGLTSAKDESIDHFVTTLSEAGKQGILEMIDAMEKMMLDDSSS
ncbi:unnamed protein product [Phytophthora lilii]|uniref:Unnamed protein product n=1 Tax=Phytophthora lilii TaxID=2077276 RepID=A0A9W6TSF4_9STRA|nr:unnamed protein product [Phytophthora lilii]